MFELDPARRDELIEAWAQHIVARGLGTAAVFLLEAHKPLAGPGAQVLAAFLPVLQAILAVNVHELAAFMHEPANVERLIRRIELKENGRQEAQAARHARRAEVRRRARRIRACRRCARGR